jgi:hypothetical protein
LARSEAQPLISQQVTGRMLSVQLGALIEQAQAEDA